MIIKNPFMIAIRCLAYIFSGIAVCILVAVLWINIYPETLRDIVNYAIHDVIKDGKCSVGGVYPSFFPSQGIIIDDLSVSTAEGLNIKSKHAEVYIDLLALFKARIKPTYAKLDNFAVEYIDKRNKKENFSSDNNSEQDITNNIVAYIKHISGLDIIFLNGNIVYSDGIKSTPLLDIHNLSGKIKIPSFLHSGLLECTAEHIHHSFENVPLSVPRKLCNVEIKLQKIDLLKKWKQIPVSIQKGLISCRTDNDSTYGTTELLCKFSGDDNHIQGNISLNGSVCIDNITTSSFVKKNKSFTQTALYSDFNVNFEEKVTSGMEVKLSNTKIKVNSTELNGNINFVSSNDSISVDVNTNITNVRDILSRLKIDIPSSIKKTMLNQVSISGNMQYTKDKTIKVSINKGNIDKSTFYGTCAQDMNGAYSFDLHLGDVNIDEYMQKSDHIQKSTKKTNKVTFTIKELNSIIDSIDINGTLYIDSLTIFNNKIDKIYIPLTIKNGKIEAKKSTSIYFDGAQELSLEAFTNTFYKKHHIDESKIIDKSMRNKSYLDVHAAYLIKDVDMLKMTNTFSPEMLLNSKLDTYISVNGPICSFEDILKYLQGTYKIQGGNGTFKLINSETKKIDKDISITSIDLNGQFNNNIVKWTDSNILISNIKISGNGYIDIIHKIIDYKINISMYGLPSIPFLYHGSLSSSSNLIVTIIGILTDVCKSIFSIVGNILLSPLQFLN